MTPFERLFVIWRTPASGARHVIGELWRDPGGGYGFAYAADLRAAVEAGFPALPEFPDFRPPAPYRGRYLFTTFAQRVPSPRRPDRGELLRGWGVVDGDDPLEILARSGGIQLTDRFEFVEYRPIDDPLARPLHFRIAGAKFQTPPPPLSIGSLLTLRREPENPHDRTATEVLFGEARAGYVPMPYSALVARLLDAGVPLRVCVVRRILVPEDCGRWVVEATREGIPGSTARTAA